MVIGEERGIEIGARIKQEKTAIKMLSHGLSTEEVAEYTGLTKKQVK